ncbi:hypothetical protein FB451DRAFT_1177481 [Mycena latifolia]|nr:hypothetical protein FB451DRAFT_1177481 [Mycena latifolia]
MRVGYFFRVKRWSEQNSQCFTREIWSAFEVGSHRPVIQERRAPRSYEPHPFASRRALESGIEVQGAIDRQIIVETKINSSAIVRDARVVRKQKLPLGFKLVQLRCHRGIKRAKVPRMPIQLDLKRAHLISAGLESREHEVAKDTIVELEKGMAVEEAEGGDQACGVGGPDCQLQEQREYRYGFDEFGFGDEHLVEVETDEMRIEG